jgi:hypothetical protein
VFLDHLPPTGSRCCGHCAGVEGAQDYLNECHKEAYDEMDGCIYGVFGHTECIDGV